MRPDAGGVELDGAPLPGRRSAGRPPARRQHRLPGIHARARAERRRQHLSRARARPAVPPARARWRARCRRVLDELGVDVDVHAPVGQLSVAQQQMVEIARALERRREACSSSTSRRRASPAAKSSACWRSCAGCATAGSASSTSRTGSRRSSPIADRVTVLRDGRHVATAAAAGLDRAQLIRWMVGRDVSEEFPPRAATPGDAGARGARPLGAAALSRRLVHGARGRDRRAGRARRRRADVRGARARRRARRATATCAFDGAAGALRIARGRDRSRPRVSHGGPQGPRHLPADARDRRRTSRSRTCARSRASGLLSARASATRATRAARDFDVRAASLDAAGRHAVGRQPAEDAARALPARAADAS